MGTDELYSTYDQYKGWSAEPVPVSKETFEAIIEASGKQGPLRIIEMGFGDGAFLDWARANGHFVVGTEIRDSALEVARARGHTVYGNWPAIEPVDLIVALDVLEHLSREEMFGLFDQARQLLKLDGAVVARFPNGSSPFFGHFQYGDYTHDRPISPGTVQQLALIKGFDLVRAVNPRPVPTSFRRAAKARAAYFVRDVIEIVLGYAYFGSRVPMDPNVVVVLARRA